MLKFCSNFNVLYDIITSKLKFSGNIMSKKIRNQLKKSKMKYIIGTGAIIVSTTLLPKVLKKTTNYLYKNK